MALGVEDVHLVLLALGEPELVELHRVLRRHVQPPEVDRELAVDEHQRHALAQPGRYVQLLEQLLERPAALPTGGGAAQAACEDTDRYGAGERQSITPRRGRLKPGTLLLSIIGTLLLVLGIGFGVLMAVDVPAMVAAGLPRGSRRVSMFGLGMTARLEIGRASCRERV